MKSRVACCPTVSLTWEDFLCVISFATAVSFFFYVCLGKMVGHEPHDDVFVMAI